jgi:hypothetical protein
LLSWVHEGNRFVCCRSCRYLSLAVAKFSLTEDSRLAPAIDWDVIKPSAIQTLATRFGSDADCMAAEIESTQIVDA